MPNRTLLVLVFGMTCTVTGLVAQSRPFSVTLEAGLVRFSGTTAPAPGSDRSPARPDRSAEFAARVERQTGAVSLALALRYSETEALIFEDDDPVAVIVRGVSLRAYDVAPEIGVRIVTGRGDRSLSIHGGPLVTRWTAKDSEARTRLGAHITLALDLPFSERVAGILRTGVTVGGSLFTEDEVSPELTRRATWRRTFGLGLRYHL